MVREQIANLFRDPELLISKGILPQQNPLPRVYEMTSVIQDQATWQDVIINNDVIVGIPGTIDQTPNLQATIGANAFDLVFVDEAHHSRAKSWNNVLNAFVSSKQILLTATPFRRDKKDIKARLVYNYPLKQAYDDGLFSKINYIPVSTVNLNTEEEKNIAIAKKTQEIYNNRNHSEHKIIIRTDTKNNADSLVRIYKEETDLNLVLLYSSLGEATIKRRIEQLKNGEIDGVICVDMMGEGFDFPLLKIAAVHIPHKSLAITLQFVGRISRTNTAGGKEATIIAGEHEFELEAEQLYKKDTKDWSIVLPELHYSKVQKTEEEQEFFDSFEGLTENEVLPGVDIEETVSIEDDDLLPFFHAKLYKIIRESTITVNVSKEGNDESLIDISKTIDYESTNVFKNPVIRHHHVSEEHKVAIYVVAELKKPKWYLSSDALNDIENHLIIVFFDSATSILAICSTLKETELYEDIVEQYLSDGIIHEMIYLPYLKRVMAGWNDPRMYNIGMKSRKTKGNSEAYKNILGSHTANGVLPTDKYSYTRGHSFGGGFDTVLQKHVLIGVSTSSKVWTLDEKKIKYLVDWLKEIGRKINDPAMDALTLPLDELDSGKIVEEFPMEDPPFFADWNSQQYYKLAQVRFENNEGVEIAKGLLSSCSITILDYTNTHVTFVIKKETAECHIVYSINPKIDFQYSDTTPTKIAFKHGESYGKTEVLLSNLKANPIQIYYENLSHLVGKVLFDYKDTIAVINNNQIVLHNWPNIVNVNKEFYKPDEITANNLAGDSRLSIHDYILGLAEAEFDAVFYDHASLEIADVIGLSNGRIKFYHCKKQDGDAPRCTVDDIYEVNGQATKSVQWANRRLLLQQLIDRADKNNSAAKIRKGTLNQIKQILESFDNPSLPVEIVIVHPGLKTQNLAVGQQGAYERIKTLLSASDTYMKDVSSCKLSVMCS